MKTAIIILGAAWLLSSCAAPQLYSWSNYETTSYDYLKKSDERSIQALIKTYNYLIENQSGTRNLPPPGICADYGFVLFQMGNMDQAKALLLKETELYPESKLFIDRILKLIEN